jgi:hypothetical protein
MNFFNVAECLPRKGLQQVALCVRSAHKLLRKAQYPACAQRNAGYAPKLILS